MLPDPLRFAARVVESMGGLAEFDGDGAAVLLPDGLAARLGFGPDARLGEGGVACGLGSHALDALIDTARADGRAASVRLDASPPSDAAMRTLASGFALRNGVVDVRGVGRSESIWVDALFGWTVEADEQQSGQFAAVVHAEGALSDPAFGAAALASGQDAESVALDGDTARALARAAAYLSREPTGAAIASANRRRQRDRERIGSYYGRLAEEARAPRRKLDPASVDAKIAHLLRERDHRIREIDARYAARVRVEIVSLVTIQARCGLATLRLRRRKAEREIVLRVPSGTRSLDRLPCDGCGGYTLAPVACDDRLHLLCERCEPQSSGRPRCPKCVEP
jgi:hypothetical protein